MKPLPEWAKTVRFYGLFALAYFAFTSVAFAQYFIPSGSMRPALEIGDRIIVNKFAYGWSRYSLPILVAELVPIHGRLFPRAPERGDIIVFRRPDQKLILIKRVIGLPGETVEVHDGMVFIDESPLPQLDATQVVLTEGQRSTPAERLQEVLPGGQTHPIYDLGRGGLDNFGPYTVPEDCFLALGDNRDDSQDGRVWGCVPMENLVGRAETIGWTLAWRHPDPNKTRDPKRLWRGL